MSKQINLLAQERAAPALSALNALIGLGALLIAFLGYGVIGWLGTARLGDTIEQSNAELAESKAAVNALQQKLGERPKLADIIAQIEALKPQVAESQELMSILRSGGAGSAGYSGHLAALAAISEDGVWLTGVKIGNSGKTMSLSGRSLRNESVMRYAQRLNAQFSAYGVQFTGMELIPEATRGTGSDPSSYSVVFNLF